MDTELKEFFKQRLNFVLSLASLYDSYDSLTNFDLKQAGTVFENEIDYQEFLLNIGRRKKYYEYQNELISDLDVLSYVTMGKEAQKKWMELTTKYINETNSNKQYFDKLTQVYKTDINNINSFINFVISNSDGQNEYYNLLTDGQDFNKSLFYCFIPMYIKLVYDNKIVPCISFTEAMTNNVEEEITKAMTNNIEEEITNKPIIFENKKNIEIPIKKNIIQSSRNEISNRNNYDRNIKVYGADKIEQDQDMISIIMQCFKMSKLFIKDM